jgi:thiol:disulfide interchange protein DsbD
MALGVWFALAAIAAAYLLGWLKLGNDHDTGKIGWLRRGFGVATIVAGFLCLAAMDGFNLGKIGALLPPDPYPGRESGAKDALPWIRSYNDAVAQAKASNKPIFINFTGYTCTNCRYMEQNILIAKDVRSELSNMVIAELYTDGKTVDNEENQKLQQKLTGSVTLPIYVVLSPKGEVISQFGGSTEDSEEFAKFIREGKSKLSSVASR